MKFTLPLTILMAASSLLAPAFAQDADIITAHKAADDRLNEVYQNVIVKYTGDAAAAERIRAAQRAWVAYRNAHLQAIFPEEDKRLHYGSSYTHCSCAIQLPMIQQRTEELLSFLKVEEGDVCNGSR